MVDYKLVDGKLVPLTDNEEYARANERIALQNELIERAQKENIPDLATQIAGALINKGVLSTDDFHADTFTAIDIELANSNISISSNIK